MTVITGLSNRKYQPDINDVNGERMTGNMTEKGKILYLILAVACFLGIILIFIFDGYIGVYRTLDVDNGQYVQTIGAEQWEKAEDRYLLGFSVEEGQTLQFTYRVENRRFSGNDYPLTVYYVNQGETIDLVDTELNISAFGSKEVVWTLDTSNLIPADYPTDRQLILTMTIKAGDNQNDMSIYINRNYTDLKLIPPIVD